MKKHYTYILRSKVDKKHYIGNTSDVNARLLKHNTGQVASTRNRRPFDLIHVENFENKKEALQREHYLKKLKSSKYIEKYICPDSSIG